MGNRLTKIYTRTGDDGTTGMADGTRVEKNAPRIQAIGDVDELNSQIGLLLGKGVPERMHELLTSIQHQLFDLGAELSMPGHRFIRPAFTGILEQAIDLYNAELPPLKEFILPGGNEQACHCHLARAVCRRAERTMVELAQAEEVSAESLGYINRLSDLMFVLARTLARLDGGQEIYWRGLRDK